MKNKKVYIIIVFFSIVNWSMAFAQPDTTAEIQVKVVPNRANWLYKIGEDVIFTVSVLDKGRPMRNVDINYQWGPERMAPEKTGTLVVKGKVRINAGTMKSPGFLRLIVTAMVNGKEYRSLATAGFAPQDIKAVAEMPGDFMSFWTNAIKESGQIPMDVKMTLMPERCTEKVNVYQINMQHYNVGSRLYGILCIPKKEGKYPAILKFPGGGVWPSYGEPALAEKDVITFNIGIHGLPLNLAPEVYSGLSAGALNGYFFFNLDDRDSYYLKRVYLGCIRAIDYLFTLPQFDGHNLAVDGGSQGGALAIATAALDPRVKYLAALYPAMCDLTGYLHGRAGGSPQMFSKTAFAEQADPKKITTSTYYDIVNFSRLLKTPGYYSWGFNDEACAPTSTHAAYNEIKAPKELFIDPPLGHWSAPDQWDRVNSWLLKRFKESKF